LVQRVNDAGAVLRALLVGGGAGSATNGFGLGGYRLVGSAGAGRDKKEGERPANGTREAEAEHVAILPPWGKSVGRFQSERRGRSRPVCRARYQKAGLIRADRRPGRGTGPCERAAATQ